MKTLSVLTFIALVVVSNWLTARYGLVYGIATAGTVTAGLVLLVRDWVHEAGGLRWVFGSIAAGAGLSAAMAGPALGLASGVAFAVSELADLAIYTPLRRSGRLRAAAVSNAIGSVVDSVLFLWLAGFPLWPAAGGQVAVKWTVSVAIPLLAWVVGRAVLRHTVRA